MRPASAASAAMARPAIGSLRLAVAQNGSPVWRVCNVDRERSHEEERDGKQDQHGWTLDDRQSSRLIVGWELSMEGIPSAARYNRYRFIRLNLDVAAGRKRP